MLTYHVKRISQEAYEDREYVERVLNEIVALGGVVAGFLPCSTIRGMHQPSIDDSSHYFHLDIVYTTGKA